MNVKDEPPVITTDRLILRPPAPADADRMPPVYNDPEVAANTISIPHPYTRDDAVAAIEMFVQQRRSGAGFVFFIDDRATGGLVGSVGVERKNPPGRGELGYVVASAWRGRGYATEAARAMVGFAFETLGLSVVTAHAMLHNPASAKVLEKLGMRPLGVIAGACAKNGQSIDAHGFEMTRKEWRHSQAGDETAKASA